MEFTFEYDVETTNTDVIIASVEFKEELTDEQAERLKASFRTGKYHFLDEDDSHVGVAAYNRSPGRDCKRHPWI